MCRVTERANLHTREAKGSKFKQFLRVPYFIVEVPCNREYNSTSYMMKCAKEERYKSRTQRAVRGFRVAEKESRVYYPMGYNYPLGLTVR